MSADSDFYRRCFLVTAAALLAYLLWLILSPLRGALGWAAVLAFSLHPLHVGLARRLKGRRALSAAILTALTPFLVLAPLGLLGVAFAGQVARLVTYMRTHTFLPYPELLERLSGYPVIGSAVAWVRDNATVSAEQVQGWATQSLESLLKTAAATGGNLALEVFGTLVSFFVMLFLLFFLLQNGRAIFHHLVALIPIAAERRKRLLKYLGDVTRAVVFGSVATALIDGVLVGVGFAIAGLPSPVVFGVLGAIAAFLPSGAGIVLVPAVAYLAIAGRWGAALFLGLWTMGLFLGDTVLRSLLAKRRAEVSTAATFIGAMGGTVAFGILGLIIGPVLLSFAVALVRSAEETLPANV
jgi:predicted PurR-regulated permease PerM